MNALYARNLDEKEMWYEYGYVNKVVISFNPVELNPRA